MSFTEKKAKQRFIPIDGSVQINDKEKNILKFSEDTLASVSFQINDKERKRIMTLNFQYSGEIFTKYIPIPYSETDFNVAFLPEGGYLPAGTNGIIAFKAIKTNGLSENITGKIVDENTNDVITEFRSTHLGMGKFAIQPKEGKTYYAECTNDKGVTKRFHLPTAVAGYCGLQINRVQDRIYVVVRKTGDYDPTRSLYLLAHLRGAVLYCKPVDNSREHVIFEDSFFPSGIVQFLLIDDKKEILSERLVFNYNKNDIAQVSFSTDKADYTSKQHILAQVKLTDIHNQPLTGNISVSVTDDKDILPDSCVNIISHLLLSSELKGYIENPNYYLKQNDRKASQALDLLMLTQGWRRYDISNIVKGNPVKPIYLPETSQVISGKADGVFSSIKDGYISILALTDTIVEAETVKSMPDGQAAVEDEIKMASVVPHVVQTDQTGRFELKDIEFPEETRFIVQANTKKKKGRWVFLELDKTTPYPLITGLIPSYNYSTKGMSEAAIAKAEEKYVMENGMRVVNLAEVTVTAQQKKQTSSSPYYTPLSSSQVITADMIEKRNYMDMQTLLYQIPGIMFTNGEMSVRGGGAPLVILDNVPYESEFFSILDLNVSEVSELFLVKDASAGIMFGPRASSGALVINTKKGNFAERNTKSENISDFIKPLGYQKPSEFYSPKYETTRENSQPDLRTTIFWNPNVLITENGEASFDFYSADAKTTYSVVIEGVSVHGHLIYKLAKIKREK